MAQPERILWLLQIRVYNFIGPYRLQMPMSRPPIKIYSYAIGAYGIARENYLAVASQDLELYRPIQVMDANFQTSNKNILAMPQEPMAQPERILWLLQIRVYNFISPYRLQMPISRPPIEKCGYAMGAYGSPKENSLAIPWLNPFCNPFLNPFLDPQSGFS